MSEETKEYDTESGSVTDRTKTLTDESKDKICKQAEFLLALDVDPESMNSQSQRITLLLLAEITQLRAALEDKVVASDDYEAVDLGVMDSWRRDLLTEGKRSRATELKNIIVELLHHRRLAVLNMPRTVVECQGCKRGYLPRDGCLWCRAKQLEADKVELITLIGEMNDDYQDEETVVFRFDHYANSVVSLITKHTPDAKGGE